MDIMWTRGVSGGGQMDLVDQVDQVDQRDQRDLEGEKASVDPYSFLPKAVKCCEPNWGGSKVHNAVQSSLVQICKCIVQ